MNGRRGAGVERLNTAVATEIVPAIPSPVCRACNLGREFVLSMCARRTSISFVEM